MKSYAKAALGVLAALAAIGAVAPSPASAQEWRDREYHRHYRPHYYHPGYVYAPPPPVYYAPPPPVVDGAPGLNIVIPLGGRR